MNIPSSVYHLQLSKNFPLKKAIQLIPYLCELGVEGICCSPLFASFSNGYDVTNPNLFNPDLGTVKEFQTFFLELKRYGIKHILDVVPNHMGIKGDKNTWWMDVLKKGPKSAYAAFFDINWKQHQGKVVLPVLGKPLDILLKNGEVQLVRKNGVWLKYYDYLFPVNIQKQFYVLEEWLASEQERNYRRFFNINDLIGIHIENKKVLDAHHRLVFDLIRKGHVQGLRIDHPDGLYDPTQYLKRIRQKKPGLIWVEKILTKGECLPEKWPVDGTVGYDFLNFLSGLFVDQKNEQKITKIYDQFIRKKLIYSKIFYERRKKYAQLQMQGDIRILADFLSKTLKSYARQDLMRACLEIIACFPVYRTYIKPGSEVRKKDREYVKIAIKRAKAKAPEIATSLFEHIQKILLSPRANSPELHFLMHLQQSTAAAMAKGIEDSADFIYNRLISLNEVGNSSNDFGCTKEEFHAFNLRKLKLWPLGPLTSSTHDSKYSEDARLRLHLLSEIPEKWKSLVYAWRRDNKKHFVRIKGRLIPEPNTEYYIYQILMALGPDDPDRLWNCLRKALREADCFTSWRKVDENYESAVKQFLIALLKKPNEQFLLLQKEIADLGYLNSLSALALKIGSCGIFDLYQGDELLNPSLMDPDNRRPVDFDKRRKELFHLQNLKIRMTAKGLRFRRSHKELFLKGDYIPLKTSRSVIAFARKWKEEEILVVAGRFFTEKQKRGSLSLPPSLRGKIFQDLFTDKKIVVKKQRISLSEIFSPYPFTVLIRSKS